MHGVERDALRERVGPHVLVLGGNRDGVAHDVEADAPDLDQLHPGRCAEDAEGARAIGGHVRVGRYQPHVRAGDRCRVGFPDDTSA